MAARRRTVELSVQSELKRTDGTTIMRSKYKSTAQDEKCGKERILTPGQEGLPERCLSMRHMLEPGEGPVGPL